jgi:hypothetical protein
MINSVRNDLNAILGTFGLLNNATGAGRAFELYVMTGIAREMQNRGFEVWLQRSDGSRINPGDAIRTFIQRGGAPSAVPSASEGPNKASVIGMRRSQNHEPWELWNGIQFTGRSGANHEIDIALVPALVGVTIRSTSTGGTPFGRPRVAIECKDVQAAGSPDEMRALIARLYDLSLLIGHPLNYTRPLLRIYPGSPSNHAIYRAQSTYREENQNSYNALARKTTFSQGSQDMTAYYEIRAHGNIALGSTGYSTLISDVGQWIENELP